MAKEVKETGKATTAKTSNEKVAKEAKAPKAPKAAKEVKEIVLPADNAAQFAKNEELAAILKGGKALTSKIQKVKATSASKVREGFPGYLHLLPVTESKALAFIWDTREIVEVVDTTNLTEADMVGRVKDSGLPLRLSSDNKDVKSLLA
jgi:hypothetical protein